MIAAINRRRFLQVAAGAAASAAMPANASSPMVAVDLAGETDMTTIWVTGTPGEFNWRAFDAPSAEEAFRLWQQETGNVDLEFSDDCARRLPALDGKHPDAIAPADWIENDMGHCCERCGYETSADAGAIVVAGEVVGEECATIADNLAVADDERAVEILVDIILDHEGDAGAAQVALSAAGAWDAVRPVHWLKAVSEADAL